ncbi:uroporphyrinogen-III C-methyltransferase [Ideonella sp. 3Y2]|uniref:Uroporphyrinogen-III C-methyltransferase n=1 Tax=Ideonella alba TaxID=2824118 RepID=A0A940Y545_9BURK|nr:uroporphyrinogen-III C-methyltransferase [Ideonella alba]
MASPDPQPSETPAEAPVAAPVLPASPAAAPAAASAPASAPVTPAQTVPWRALGLAAVGAASVAAAVLAWNTQQRVKQLEQELVRRQQGSQDLATEARLLARQAQEAGTEMQGKLGVLEARVAETALQRSQVEELMQSMSRSRDENVLADVEASLRVALQQSAITGSAEPLVAALRQADERLARYNQPRMERVRRAVVRDLDRVRAAQVVDVPALAVRLDEAVRQVDDLPLLSTPERRPAAASAAAPAASAAARAASAPALEGLAWREVWDRFSAAVWHEARSLLRVTRIDRPEASLMSPEQGFFLRENLKLRLLNARLSLLSRQFDLAQADLTQAQQMLERYFDRSSRRVQSTSELARQVAQQARHVSLPRPEETLAALAAAVAGR